MLALKTITPEDPKDSGSSISLELLWARRQEKEHVAPSWEGSAGLAGIVGTLANCQVCPHDLLIASFPGHSSPPLTKKRGDIKTEEVSNKSTASGKIIERQP